MYAHVWHIFIIHIYTHTQFRQAVNTPHSSTSFTRGVPSLESLTRRKPPTSTATTAATNTATHSATHTAMYSQTVNNANTHTNANTSTVYTNTSTPNAHTNVHTNAHATSATPHSETSAVSGSIVHANTRQNGTFALPIATYPNGTQFQESGSTDFGDTDPRHDGYFGPVNVAHAMVKPSIGFSVHSVVASRDRGVAYVPHRGTS
jgi:hypothetical protein